MGISELVMSAMMEHMVVLATALGTLMGPGYCRWAKLSRLQHIVYEAGSQAGNICCCPGEKYSRLYYGVAGGQSQGS